MSSILTQLVVCSFYCGLCSYISSLLSGLFCSFVIIFDWNL